LRHHRPDGRNHRSTHRTEYNKTMKLWVCGCGWKGKKRESHAVVQPLLEGQPVDEDDGSGSSSDSRFFVSILLAKGAMKKSQ